MHLLFITQKIDENDDDLAFTILWVKEFIKQGADVQVICLEKGAFDNSFPVYSLGKERGTGTLARTWYFLKLITALKYNRVFVHMNPEYFTLGGWWWALRGIPSYLWYTHYTMTTHLFLAGLFAKKLFAATAQSLPQYEGNPKKVVLGHGIDITFWGEHNNVAQDSYALISVHRLSRSKRLEIVLQTLALLPAEYTLTVYGRQIDRKYFEELQRLSNALGITSRVRFVGPVPMPELKKIYPRHHLMLNMASETIDKTMLESMLFGVYPITTPANARAIGLSVFPHDENPETIAAFITNQTWETGSHAHLLLQIVKQKHSLSALVAKMNDYLIYEK